MAFQTTTLHQPRQQKNRHGGRSGFDLVPGAGNPCGNLAVLSTAPNPCRNLAVLVLRTLRVIAICARPSETLETTGGAVQNLTLTLPLGFQVVGLVKLHIGQYGGRRYRIYWMFLTSHQEKASGARLSRRC